MICRKCGELLGDGTQVCPVCGTRQTGSAGTTINPTHSGSDDCAHEESHQPRKRRAGSPLRLLPVLILPLLFFLIPVLTTRLGVDGNNVITIVVAILFGVSAISSIVNARRK